MAIMKEWRCLIHGEFDGTHPICPGPRCASKVVVQEFRTAPGAKSARTKFTDAGLRKSADMYGINNFKSAKPGEVSFAGRSDPALGQKVLWGDECKQVFGQSFSQLTQTAAKPLAVPTRDGRILSITRNNGMVEAAEAAGITRSKLPRAGEITRSPKDASP